MLKSKCAYFPKGSNVHSLLAFQKDALFYAENNKPEDFWWWVRNDQNQYGYVPSKFMEDICCPEHHEISILNSRISEDAGHNSVEMYRVIAMKTRVNDLEKILLTKPCGSIKNAAPVSVVPAPQIVTAGQATRRQAPAIPPRQSEINTAASFTNRASFKDHPAPVAPVEHRLVPHSDDDNISVKSTGSRASSEISHGNSTKGQAPLPPAAKTAPVAPAIDQVTNIKNLGSDTDAAATSEKPRLPAIVTDSLGHNSDNIIEGNISPQSTTAASAEEELATKEALSPDTSLARNLVDKIRLHSNLSFSKSNETVQLVLTQLSNLAGPNLNQEFIHQLLDKLVEIQLSSSSSAAGAAIDIDGNADARLLSQGIDQLVKYKEDSQQRGWHLHDDEHIILKTLLQIISTLRNAETIVSLMVLRSLADQFLSALIDFFLLETRASIRKELITIIFMTCDLIPNFATTFIQSELPTQIATVCRHAFSDATTAGGGGGVNEKDLLELYLKLMCLLLSRPTDLPFNHKEALGEEFVDNIVDIIEREISDEVSDRGIILLLAYNLHFVNDCNIVMKTLRNRQDVRVLTERLMLFINRHSDPLDEFIKISSFSTSISKQSSHVMTTTSTSCHSRHQPIIADQYSLVRPRNSLLVFFIDMFSTDATFSLFYSNDLRVLVDIFIRQIADLPPPPPPLSSPTCQSAGGSYYHYSERWDYLELIDKFMTMASTDLRHYRSRELGAALKSIVDEEEVENETMEASRERDKARVILKRSSFID